MRRYTWLMVMCTLAQVSFALPPKEQSTDDILSALEAGNIASDGVLELGERQDSRILPLVTKAAKSYKNRIVRISQERHVTTIDPWLLQMDEQVRSSAKRVAARLGDKTFFEEFVSGLSSTDGKKKKDSIEALAYVGDRAAIRHLIPLTKDMGTPEEKTAGYEPPSYAYYALISLRRLLPGDSMPQALKDSSSLEQQQRELNAWWKKNKSEYGTLKFGVEKIRP